MRDPRRNRWEEGWQMHGKIMIFLAALAVWPAWNGMAQAQAPKPATDLPLQVYGLAEFNGSNPVGEGAGFAVGVAGDLRPWLGLAAEVRMARTLSAVVDNITVSDILAGPRFMLPLGRRSRVTPFADLLGGLQYLTNSSNHHSWYYTDGGGPAVGGDGGADFSLSRRLAARVQAGVLYSRFSASPGPAVSNTRLQAAAGLVYRF